MNFKKFSKSLLSIASVLILVTCLSACQSKQCAQMLHCCSQVKDMEGVGKSCGPLAEQTTDPDSCRTITTTIRYMLEKRKQTIPKACEHRP